MAEIDDEAAAIVGVLERGDTIGGTICAIRELYDWTWTDDDALFVIVVLASTEEPARVWLRRQYPSLARDCGLLS